MKKIVWVAIGVFLAATATFLFYFYLPDPLEKEYSSIIYSPDSGFERKTTVQLSGTKYQSLFGRDYFTGRLTVDNDLNYEIRLEWSERYYFGTIADFDAAGLLHTSGSVMSSDRFEKVWIQLNDINQRYNLTGYVSGPADNLMEGNEVAKQILGVGQN